MIRHFLVLFDFLLKNERGSKSIGILEELKHIFFIRKLESLLIKRFGFRAYESKRVSSRIQNLDDIPEAVLIIRVLKFTLFCKIVWLTKSYQEGSCSTTCWNIGPLSSRPWPAGRSSWWQPWLFASSHPQSVASSCSTDIRAPLMRSSWGCLSSE